jgi:hypothetical protein
MSQGKSSVECAQQTGSMGQMQAATSGVKDGMLNQKGISLPPGLDLNSIRKAMDHGGFMAAYDAVAQKLPAEGRAMMGSFKKPLEKDGGAFVRSLGLMNGSTVNGTLAKLSGGKKSASGATGAMPFAFGKGGLGALKAPGGAMEFSGKTEAALEVEGTDIWHEGDTRSLFQIVSKKIDRSRPKVESFEWESPLNRALHGLGRKPASSTELTPSPAVKY